MFVLDEKFDNIIFFAIFYPPKTQFFRTLRGLVPTLPELRCHLSSGKVITVMSTEFYRNISCRIYGSKAVRVRCYVQSNTFSIITNAI